MATHFVSSKTITTNQNLAFEHFPEAVNGLVSKFYSYFLPKYANKATQIATVSTFTKQDIIEKYAIKPSKVTVTYNSADEKFKPLPNEQKMVIRENHTGKCAYFLYVGALHPRKNIERLLLAFDKFKGETSSLTKLVLVGRKAWGNREMEASYESMKFNTF